MFSKEESRQLNFKFWNGFSVYMSKIRSSNGRKINWLNYPSDAKSVFIRLEADSKGARLCLDIQHKDDEIRALIWEQMTELKMVLEDITSSSPIWKENFYSTNKQFISRIIWEDATLNFYISEHKEMIYLFLKDKLIKFDLFYQEYKEILISLTN
jgi:hypothetical protein